MIEIWPLVILGVVMLAVLVAFAGFAVVGARRAYRLDAPLVFAAWLAFIVCCPIAGTLCWFLWDGWLRPTTPVRWRAS